MNERQPHLQALGERLAEEQDALLARSPDRAVFRGVNRRKPWRARWALDLAVALVLVGLLAAVLVVRTRPLDLSVSGTPAVHGQWITASRDAPVPLRFSDGTEVLLAPEGRARVLEVTPIGAHVMLESGVARVSVTPNRGGRWTFSAGPFTVEVRGTRFEIDWSPQEEQFKLTLAEGKVTVSGCALGDARSLFAGEALVASCRSNDFQIARGPEHDAPSTQRDAPLTPPALSTPIADRLAGPPPAASGASTTPSATASVGAPSRIAESWQSLARAGKFKDSFARVNASGTNFDVELRRDDVADLLLLGDVSRLSGNPSEAVRAYQRLRERAPGTESAANAAFSMGRVAFDQRDAYADAARWFSTYLSERRDGPLAREALGREMEALSRAGDRAGAARVAEQYLALVPEGPYAPLATTLRSTEPR
jgi:transmembrane sensor